MEKKLLDEWLDEMSGVELTEAEYQYIVEFARRWVRQAPEQKLTNGST